MTAKCVYQQGGALRCTKTPTDHVIGSCTKDDWRVIRRDALQPWFCEPHAKAVAAQRNARWRQARALLSQMRKRSKVKLRCRVCGELLMDGGQDVPEVGRCC